MTRTWRATCAVPRSGFPSRQEARHTQAPSRQARLDRPDRDVEHVGRFLVCEADHVDENEHAALFQGHLRKDPSDVESGSDVGFDARIRAPGSRVRVRGDDSGTPPQDVVASVHDDPVQPCGESSTAVVAAQDPHELAEDVLGNVERRFAVAHDPDGDAEDAVAVADVEGGEGVPVTGRGGRRELDVTAPFRFSHLR